MSPTTSIPSSKRVTYAQAPHLFRNLGGRKFDDISLKVGPAFQRGMVARGAAFADYDNDGDPDLLVSVNNGAAKLLRNDGGNTNHRLRIRTVGSVSNRDGIGARITVTTAAGAQRWGLVKTGSSFASQSELPVTFGLGVETSVSAIEVRWPSGKVNRVGRVDADRTITIEEGRGLVQSGRMGPRGR